MYNPITQDTLPLLHEESFAHPPCKEQTEMSAIDHRVNQIIDHIQIHYEPHAECLVLRGKIALLKTTLAKIVKLADCYFRNPFNRNLNCCQINMFPLDDIHGASNRTPFIIKTRMSVFNPNDSDQGSHCVEEDVENFQNKALAEHLSSTSFYVSRDWNIWRLPHDNREEKLFEGTNNVVYKILNISEAQFFILKMLPQPLSDSLGSEADATMCHRFQVLNDLYKEVQSHNRMIPLQEPPFAVMDMRLPPFRLVKGLVENFFPEGDLFDLIKGRKHRKIPLISRLNFCHELANYFRQLVEDLGIYHTDIKTENILVKKTAKNTYELFIGDYADCIKFEPIFDKFEQILKHFAITPEDADYIHSLRYIHTRTYTHRNDIDKLLHLLHKGIKDIFRVAGTNHPKRLEEFRLYKNRLVELAVKHQIFALGISFFQILIGPYSPYSEVGPTRTLYCGEGRNQLFPSSLNHLSKRMQLQSPHSVPLIDKIAQFVMTMLEDDFQKRPDFATVCREFEMFAAALSESPSPVRSNETLLPISPPPTRKRSPGPTAIAILEQSNRVSQFDPISRQQSYSSH